MNQLRLFAVFYLLLVGWSPSILADEAPFVKLKSTDGKTIEAIVLHVADDSVKVKRKDGKEFDIPLSRLTAETVAEIKKAAAAPPASEKKPAATDEPAPFKPTKSDDIAEKLIVKRGTNTSATFEIKDGVLTKPTAVEKPDGKNPHFGIKFMGEKPPFTAILTHTFEKTLRVRCLVRVRGRKNYSEANILPIFTGMMNGETWGQDIQELVFFEFKLTDETIDNPAPGKSATAEPKAPAGVDAKLTSTDPEYGYSKKKPIKVGSEDELDAPAAERDYLNTLRDEAGEPIAFKRLGSFGKGPDGNILDGYEGQTSTGRKIVLYIDMYHPMNDPKKQPAPKGLFKAK